MHRVVLWLLLAACAEDVATFDLLRSRPVATQDLAGVDSDREGGLWLAYRQPTVNYYELAQVRVVHVDANGTTRAEHIYRDTYTRVNGIAFTGDAVWLNYAGSSVDDNRIRKLDPTTGDELASFATEVGIVDLCSRDDALLLSNEWNQLVAIDRARGGELWRAELTAFGEGGTQRGIAAKDGRTWVLSQETDHVYAVDDRGGVLEEIAMPGRQETYDTYIDHLTWDGDELLVAHNNELFWFAVPR